MEEQNIHRPVPSPASVKQAIDRARALRDQEAQAAGTQPAQPQSLSTPLGERDVANSSERQET